MVISYLAATALSLLGNAVAAVALPWLVLVRTGDAAAAGVIAAAAAVPMLLAAVVGGLVIDRFGRRRIAVVSDLASAAAVAAIPLVDTAMGLTLGAFIVLAVAGALADVPGMTAREALGPDVAAAAGMPLERLVGLREGIAGAAMIVGPAAAGGLLVVLEPTTLLWCTAAFSALAAVATATLPSRVGAGAVPQNAMGRRSVFGDLAEGVAVLRGDRLLMTFTVVSVAGLAVLAPLQGLLLPVHLVAQNAPGVLGLVIPCLALGGIAGAGLYAAVGPRWPRRRVFVSAQILLAAGVVGLALMPPTPLLLGAAALAGFGSGPLPALLMVLITERIPDAVRGRVLGLQNAITLAAAPVALLGAGVLVESIGLRPTGVLLAAAWVVLVVATLLAPALRSLEPLEVRGADDR